MKEFCFASCAWLLDVLQSSLNLNLRLASQQLSTSHCNYCACSLDIFHKSSQMAKFFLREEKEVKEREAVETQLQWLSISLLNTATACLWSMEHLKHFWIKTFAVSAQDHAYSLLDAWDTKSMLRMEDFLNYCFFFCKYNSYSEIFCRSGSERFQTVSSL